MENEESLDVSSSDVEDEETTNILFGQYCYVQKPKNKHACLFKDVIAHINGTDYVLGVVKGEMTH